MPAISACPGHLLHRRVVVAEQVEILPALLRPGLAGLDDVGDEVGGFALERELAADLLRRHVAGRGGGDGYGLLFVELAGLPEGIDIIGGRFRQCVARTPFSAAE